jgi:fructose-1,6-bisphosphatase/inositol monophosphatase family enzyme
MLPEPVAPSAAGGPEPEPRVPDPPPPDPLPLVRAVAAREILPRFRNLASGDIRAKRSPRDLVTIADEEAELRLSEGLTRLLPGSVVVGEEAADADPAVLARLAGRAPVWLIDPVDGTNNFINGNPRFAVLVALCQDGVTLAGWIYQPETGLCARAALGRGAWLVDPAGGERRLRLSPPRRIGQMCGSLTRPAARRLEASAMGDPERVPARIVRLGSTGCEYLELAQGRIDFAQYARLKPWDHAAGVLVHAEAGGFAGLRRSRAGYRPAPAILEETLLLAPDEATWRTLDGALD